jgi:adenylate cyclase
VRVEFVLAGRQDLRGFTLMWDMMAPNAVIETLKRYFDCAMLPVNRHCGEVMEIMGDGILASKEGPVQPAGKLLRRQRRGSMHPRAGIKSRPDGTPHLTAGFALHYGTVAYGNTGLGDRLDFTVIGRDVNLTSRIERLCRELDQQLIMSGEFVARLQEPLFEIGHFALRGAPRMQLLFGLPPARDLGSSLI